MQQPAKKDEVQLTAAADSLRAAQIIDMPTQPLLASPPAAAATLTAAPETWLDWFSNLFSSQRTFLQVLLFSSLYLLFFRLRTGTPCTATFLTLTQADILVTSIYEPAACDTLVTNGWWLNTLTDSSFSQWQPLGCTMATYNADRLNKCVASRSVHFVGDSNARGMFLGAAGKVGFTPKLFDKHTDIVYPADATTTSAKLMFHWDAFLNGTDLASILSEKGSTVFVLNAALWFMKYIDDPADKVSAFDAAFDRVFETVLHFPQGADWKIYISPVAAVFTENLSANREMITPDLVDRFNQILSLKFSKTLQAHPNLESRLFLVESFQNLFGDAVALAEDGIHYPPSIYGMAADVLLNHVCNEELLSDSLPMQATCCTKYRLPSWKQLFVFFLLFTSGPFVFIYDHLGKFVSTPTLPLPSPKVAKSITLLTSGVLFMYVADRTHIFMKQQKHFDPISFTFLMGAMLIGGYFTTTSGKDSTFLNRDLTDEWKGWMQIVILIYHYTGASSVSPIYNFARILVASYLFMTGFGHFIFFYKKADFGLLRIGKVLVRINLLTAVLTYVMDLPYQSYYFSPLVSIWFLLIWGVMALFPKNNKQTRYVLGKIAVMCVGLGILVNVMPLFNGVVNIIVLLTGVRWDTHEWLFRFALDVWIVPVGMLTGLVSLLAQNNWAKWNTESRTIVKTVASILAVVSLSVYMYLEYSLDKFSYNVLHPYISVAPVLAYIVLRNMTERWRKNSSGLYTYFGKISLETFIAQFHVWLAIDTKGLLSVVPEIWWLNFIITSFMFVYISKLLSDVTNELTEWLVGGKLMRNGLIFVVTCVVFNYLPV